MAQKSIKERLEEKEKALAKAEEQRDNAIKRVAKLKVEVKTLKTERTLALLAERNLDLDDLELFVDDIKELKEKALGPSEGNAPY